MPPLLLAGVTAGAAVVLRGPEATFGWVLTGLTGAAVLWIVISVLWPARAERTCPSCGGQTLERLDRETTRGQRCRACGWRDETASSFLFAEEEGPLEDIVLRERGVRRRPRTPAGRRGEELVGQEPGRESTVDTPRATD